MSEEVKVQQTAEKELDKKAVKEARKAAKQAERERKLRESGEKPHRILNFLSKEYKGENIIMLVLALFAITLGVLIVTEVLKIENVFLLDIFQGKLFAWILIGLATISLVLVFIPFYRPSLSEIKNLSGLSKSQFLLNIARTFIFIAVLIAFMVVCDLAIEPLMELIKK